MPEAIPEFISRVQAYCDAANVQAPMPWIPIGLEGGWDGIGDADKRGLFARRLSDDTPSEFVLGASADLPRALKALEFLDEYVVPFVRLPKDKRDEFARILNGEEVDDG